MIVQVAPPPRPIAKSYVNPVIDHDSPDPGVLHDQGDWWMATTGGDAVSGAFPLYHSQDLKQWERVGNLFEGGTAPAWSTDSYWAPEIHKVGDRTIAYFTARDQSGMLRIGCAVADQVQGPYTDIGSPLVADPESGVIDPTFFRDDDGRQYLYWKVDGNAFSPPRPSIIRVQELTPDGTGLTGEAHDVLRNDLEWEGDIVEAPEVEKRGDWYYLFYSGNGYWGDRYAEGVARSRSPLGPFEKMPQPFLVSSDDWKGPGHAAVTQDNEGNDWLVYHAWEKEHLEMPPGRLVLLDRIQWGQDDWPVAMTPSSGGIDARGPHCTGINCPIYLSNLLSPLERELLNQ